ncbi:alanine racemase [Microbacterium sp. Root61]|uniref:alanine racemase n=1 Tax=Microbacterium sp. Root61 TaxID=1736570 RepID=UPI0006F8674C|nr:alanine racemase [Microbacterium sp. Root61]KRA23400.1 alanine racemase [Microbacterium sp. Root61]
MTAELHVDLGTLAGNIAHVRATVAPAELMLVVKDDAYGHGLAAVVRRAWSEGVRWFGAFDVRTGCAVREELGPDARIFVWIAASAAEVAAGVAAGLDLGIGDAALLEDAAAAAAASDVRVRVHLKIDTGLHRNGVRPDEWPAFTARAAALETDGAIEVIGVWSHIAEASDAEDDLARHAFDDAVETARRAGLRPVVRHLAASAAAVARSEYRYDMVRIGAFAYGIRSAGGPGESELGVRPIAALRAPVLSVEEDGVHVGVGALHGLPSMLAGRIQAGTPAGPRAVRAIAGAESVLEPWTDAAAGQSVAIYGANDQAPLTATDLGEAIDTIGEEIAVRVSPEVLRVYSA